MTNPATQVTSPATLVSNLPLVVYDCSTFTGIRESDYAEASSDKLKIYPNPFSEVAIISIGGQLSAGGIPPPDPLLNGGGGPPQKATGTSARNGASIVVYDIMGRIVRTYTVRKGQSKINIRANEIGEGMFFVELVQGSEVIAVSKIVVLKN